jgi:hypothetical protein
MLKFLFGVIVGAVGYWAYQFWKGGEDTSWDQSFSPSTTTGNNYSSSSSRTSETAGTGSTSEGGSTSTPTY